MTIPLGPPLPARSSCQPGPLGLKRPCGRSPLPDRPPREAPIWHCSRWGLPCRPCCQVRGGLLPHRFTLTRADAGGFISVALSLGLPRPGVTRHRRLMESGLSSRGLRPPRSSGPPREASVRRARPRRQRESGGQGRRWPRDPLRSRGRPPRVGIAAERRTAPSPQADRDSQRPAPTP